MSLSVVVASMDKKEAKEMERMRRRSVYKRIPARSGHYTTSEPLLRQLFTLGSSPPLKEPECMREGATQHGRSIGEARSRNDIARDMRAPLQALTASQELGTARVDTCAVVQPRANGRA